MITGMDIVSTGFLYISIGVARALVQVCWLLATRSGTDPIVITYPVCILSTTLIITDIRFGHVIHSMILIPII